MLFYISDFYFPFLYNIWSPCRTTGHFLLLDFDDFESSLTILSLVHLVFIKGSSPGHVIEKGFSYGLQ